MKQVFLKSLVFVCYFFLVSCGGGGGGGSDGNSSSVTPSSELLQTTLPGFPHQIDVYNTANATKAIVFLHGGGGHNYEFAYNLGLNHVNAPPTNTSINWTWLEANKILAVFPQGQAISAQPSALTWSNHVMDSGVDDMAFLQALASYITSQSGITDIYLAGHSNGGMMANRVWCESPATFSAYISMAGPASDYYLSTPCSPSTVKPYYGIVGGQDSVLQVPQYGWSNQTWEIEPALVMVSGTAMPDPTLIGEWYQQVNVRAPLMCNETPSLDTPDNFDGATYTWTNCGGPHRVARDS